jgi:hypothetical protein
MTERLVFVVFAASLMAGCGFVEPSVTQVEEAVRDHLRVGEHPAAEFYMTANVVTVGPCAFTAQDRVCPARFRSPAGEERIAFLRLRPELLEWRVIEFDPVVAEMQDAPS